MVGRRRHQVFNLKSVEIHSNVCFTRNIAERCPGDQTNNRAELIAIMRVLETTPVTKKPLLIRTDSQYSIQCKLNETCLVNVILNILITGFLYWMARWQQNNWKTSSGDDVKNAGIIRCISKHLDIRAKLGQRVQLEYVKGHSGEVGNDGADAMANK
ncbi:ribonuclease H-like domain-containing protein, partial [Gymnopilus junonius]